MAFWSKDKPEHAGKYLGLTQPRAKRLDEIKEFSFPEKPGVAFPFGPLTEFVQECAAKFLNCPLKQIPDVFISPAHYFPNATNAFFHGSSNSLFFKDSYVNSVEPAELTRQTSVQLLHAWMWQHRGDIWSSEEEMIPASYHACLIVMSKLMAIELADLSDALNGYV